MMPVLVLAMLTYGFVIDLKSGAGAWGGAVSRYRALLPPLADLGSLRIEQLA